MAVFVFVLFVCLFLMDHQALWHWLHNMSTLSLDVKVLRHAQQLQHLLCKLSPAEIIASEAKHTRSVFLHSSGANLNPCLTNVRVKPERDDLLMPSSIWGHSSEHFVLRCLQFQPEAAHTNYVENLTRALLCQQTC